MNPRSLFILGVTHRTASFEFREKLALSAEDEACLARDLAALRGLREFAILATCNRMEIYGVAERREVMDGVARAFCERRGVDEGQLAQVGFRFEGPEALRHLMEVAAGLDSQMLGETEIFGQVKRAYAAAQARQSAGPVLNRLFQKAFQAAKKARTETAITAGQVSVASVAVDLAIGVFGRLEQARVLLVGAGDIGEKCARAFQSRGARRMTVASRRFERARQLAADLGADALPFEDREARLGEFDIVVCSTAAPSTVVSAEAVRRVAGSRQGRPLFFIDAAMPRDVEPEVAGEQNVFLYNLDDLAAMAEQNRMARASEAERCRSLLAGRVVAVWPQIELQLADTQPAVPGRRDEAAVGQPALGAA